MEMFTRTIRALKEALFPFRCVLCGLFFSPPETEEDNPVLNRSPLNTVFNYLDQTCFEELTAPFLCPDCLNGFAPIKSPVCRQCGMIFNNQDGTDRLCGDCITSPKRFGKARAPGIYEDTLMEMIHNLKYRGKIQLARPLGRLLFAVFAHFWDNNRIDFIIPVPLHIKRFRIRGFNQAYLLVRDWPMFARTHGAELHDLKIERDILVRSRWTDPQTGLDRIKRMSNIKNAFTVSDKGMVKEKRILLVDDVYTTGATVNECAKTLLKSGAQHVDVLTLARAT